MSPSTFTWDQIEQYGGNSCVIRRPKEILSFSYDDHRQFRFDDSSLRYYYTPELGVNLSDGLQDFIKHDDSIDGHLDGLLKGITEHEKRTGQRIEADIITWRGLITKLMCLPYESRDAFRLNAIKFQGTVFIEEDHEFAMARKAAEKPWRGPISQAEMTFWGYKFETLSTLPAPWAECSRFQVENRKNEIVNQEPQYCSVVRTGLGKTRLFIGGEVDAVWDQKPENPSEGINYVELKTSKRIESERDAINYERKLMKFWAQSFLLGVPKIIVGFRTHDGILVGTEELETQDIPKMTKRSGRGLWNANICLNFANAVLEWIVQTIPETDFADVKVWSIRHEAGGKGLEIVETNKQGFLEIGFLKWRLGASE